MLSKNDLKLISIFEEAFELDDKVFIKNLTRDNYLKWDSLASVSLIATIADSFSLDIDPKDFEMFTSFKSIKIFLINKNIEF